METRLMFCHACGAQLAKGLTYCNRCGARVAGAGGDGPSTEKLTELMYVMAAFTCGVTIGGFIFVYKLAQKLMQIGFEQSRITVIIMLCLAAAVFVAALFMRHFSRLLSAFLREGGARGAEEPRGFELPGRNTAQIEAPREPAASVTEHTTRTFDHVYVERGQKNA